MPGRAHRPCPHPGCGAVVQRGRCPTHAREKRLVERHRDKERGTATQRGSRSRAPKWLGARARAEWRRVAPGLYELGLLTELDVMALACYCQLYARAVEAEEIFTREGMVREDGTAHPCIRIARQHWSLARQFATDFGATPSSRTRINIKPPLRLANPFAELISPVGSVTQPDD